MMRVKAAYLAGFLLGLLEVGLLASAAATPWYDWDDLKGGTVTEFPTRYDINKYYATILTYHHGT